MPSGIVTTDIFTLGRFAAFADGAEVTGLTSQPVQAALLVYRVTPALALDRWRVSLSPGARTGSPVGVSVRFEVMFPVRQEAGGVPPDARTRTGR